MRLAFIMESGASKAIDNALFLVHPDFAIENWPYKRQINQLRSYYQNVIEYVDGFPGNILIHSMKPRYIIQVADALNIRAYEDFSEWMNSSKAKVVEEKDNICENPDDLLELLENLGDSVRLYWGGGYLGSCLLQTLKWIADFEESFRHIEFVPVKNLIYVPGPYPHRLDQPAEEEGQEKYTDYQIQQLPSLFRHSL